MERIGCFKISKNEAIILIEFSCSMIDLNDFMHLTGKRFKSCLTANFLIL
ncbi:MAG: hypothetical protein ACFFHV_16735 [Promethearchaeota archaeon]